MNDLELKEALSANDVNYLNYFLKTFGPNYVFEDNERDSILLYAISDEKSLAYRKIIQYGPNLYYQNNEGENVIHNIVYSGVESRLDEIGVIDEDLLNHMTKGGVTPILLACYLNKFNLFKRLLDLGADLNIADCEGIGPLHAAAQNGNLDMVKLITERGGDLFAKTKKGNIALALAVNFEHSEVVKFLVNLMYK